MRWMRPILVFWCLCAHVCMHICVHVCAYTHVCTCVHVCMYRFVSVCAEMQHQACFSPYVTQV